ncbi:hypothetical protein [Pseudomonas laurylsulfatiphila]|uniref:hypothetical protein n=1 Tax=Pseudomonas laurylsulfatiphila TaxID=2011015 RepID=UPI003D1E71B3
MLFQCPCCNSRKIASLRTAMTVGAIVGSIGGAARGTNSALAGSQMGVTLGALAGPSRIIIGTVFSAILGRLAAGVRGCALGAQLGENLDRHVLANNLCLLCGHRFNLPT